MVKKISKLEKIYFDERIMHRNGSMRKFGGVVSVYTTKLQRYF